jgi:hypothetical protein
MPLSHSFKETVSVIRALQKASGARQTANATPSCSTPHAQKSKPALRKAS